MSMAIKGSMAGMDFPTSLFPELSEITAKQDFFFFFLVIVNQFLHVAPELLGSALKSNGRAWERLALASISGEPSSVCLLPVHTVAYRVQTR